MRVFQVNLLAARGRGLTIGILGQFPLAGIGILGQFPTLGYRNTWSIGPFQVSEYLVNWMTQLSEYLVNSYPKLSEYLVN